jgi:hypothetical protein
LQVTDSEILSLTKALEGETYSLAIARASMMAIADEQLKNLVQSGINTAEARITGLQKFISENQISSPCSQTQS